MRFTLKLVSHSWTSLPGYINFSLANSTEGLDFIKGKQVAFQWVIKTESWEKMKLGVRCQSTHCVSLAVRIRPSLILLLFGVMQSSLGFPSNFYLTGFDSVLPPNMFYHQIDLARPQQTPNFLAICPKRCFCDAKLNLPLFSVTLICWLVCHFWQLQ